MAIRPFVYRGRNCRQKESAKTTIWLFSKRPCCRQFLLAYSRSVSFDALSSGKLQEGGSSLRLSLLLIGDFESEGAVPNDN